MVYKDYREAATYNKDLCGIIAMEECAELIQAISKAKRGNLDRDNLIEEIADVLVCIEWLQEVYDISTSEISEWFIKKTDRVTQRLNTGEFK